MQIQNVLKIADVLHTNISEDMLSYLQDHDTATYKDQVLKEDIYNFADEDWLEDAPEKIVKEAKTILKSISKRGCAYLRIVY